ncbi:unnamed protein product [Camellia sinensis]
MEHKFHLHLHLPLNLLLWLALTSSSFSSTVTLPCHQGGVCDNTQVAAGKGAANVKVPDFYHGERHDGKKEADQKLSKENENQCHCPMETSESIAPKQFKGVLASVIRQRLRELSEKARAATEAAHAIELLMLLGESNLGSDQMDEKVYEVAQLLRTSA